MIKSVFMTITCMGMGISVGSAAVDFEKEVWPIVKERCIKCHGASYTDTKGKLRKAKAGLRLDSPKRMLKGSEDDHKVVVPGKPEESSFIKVIKLPADHDDIMPPKGDPLTKDQIALIEKWIKEGAKFGKWEGLPEEYKHEE